MPRLFAREYYVMYNYYITLTRAAVVAQRSNIIRL